MAKKTEKETEEQQLERAVYAAIYEAISIEFEDVILNELTTRGWDRAKVESTLWEVMSALNAKGQSPFDRK